MRMRRTTRRGLFVALCILAPVIALASTTVTEVQKATATAIALTSSTPTFGATPTAQNYVVALGDGTSNSATYSFTDSLSHTLTSLVSQNHEAMAGYPVPSPTPGKTYTCAASAANMTDCGVVELAGVSTAPPSQIASSSCSSTTGACTATPTSTYLNGIVMCLGYDVTATGDISTVTFTNAGTPVTIYSELTSGGEALYAPVTGSPVSCTVSAGTHTGDTIRALVADFGPTPPATGCLFPTPFPCSFNTAQVDRVRVIHTWVRP